MASAAAVINSQPLNKDLKVPFSQKLASALTRIIACDIKDFNDRAFELGTACLEAKSFFYPPDALTKQKNQLRNLYQTKLTNLLDLLSESTDNSKTLATSISRKRLNGGQQDRILARVIKSLACEALVHSAQIFSESQSINRLSAPGNSVKSIQGFVVCFRQAQLENLALAMSPQVAQSFSAGLQRASEQILNFLTSNYSINARLHTHVATLSQAVLNLIAVLSLGVDPSNLREIQSLASKVAIAASDVEASGAPSHILTKKANNIMHGIRPN